MSKYELDIYTSAGVLTQDALGSTREEAVGEAEALWGYGSAYGVEVHDSEGTLVATVCQKGCAHLINAT